MCFTIFTLSNSDVVYAVPMYFSYCLLSYATLKRITNSKTYTQRLLFNINADAKARSFIFNEDV